MSAEQAYRRDWWTNFDKQYFKMCVSACTASLLWLDRQAGIETDKHRQTDRQKTNRETTYHSSRRHFCEYIFGAESIPTQATWLASDDNIHHTHCWYFWQLQGASQCCFSLTQTPYILNRFSHRLRSGWTSGGCMASTEGRSVPSGVGYGEGRSLPNRLGGLGSIVSSPSWVWGRAPTENGFWRILKATEHSFLYLYDKIWGG